MLLLWYKYFVGQCDDIVTFGQCFVGKTLPFSREPCLQSIRDLVYHFIGFFERKCIDGDEKLQIMMLFSFIVGIVIDLQGLHQMFAHVIETGGLGALVFNDQIVGFAMA